MPVGRWQTISREILRLIRYGLVGFSNTVVSMAVLNLFFLFWSPTTPLVLVLASTTAYAAGDLNSYWWNKNWTFGSGKPNWNWRQFGRFAVVSVVCMAINAGIVWGSSGLLLTLLLPSWLLGNAAQISMALSGAMGYLVCRCWVFKPRACPARAEVAIA